MANILIIDDVPASVDVMAEMLVREGHTVLKAADGANGLLVFRRHRPDLTFIGVHVRQDRGWEIVDNLRREDDGARIVVSGSLSTDDARKRAAGRARSLFARRTACKGF